jgi:hypothetical protein
MTRTARLLGALVLVLALAGACATPIGVVRGETRDVHRALTSSVLVTGRPSEWSTQVLHRDNLFERFEEDRAAALRELHQRLDADGPPDRLFALAELSFLHAEQTGDRDHYLASAVYAYAFLLPEEHDPEVRPVDPRGRLAVDLYNWGLSRGLSAVDGEEVVLEAGARALPFGQLELAVDRSQFVWGGYRFSRFIPVGEFVVRGLRNRYRQAGVGAPLAAELEPLGSGAEAEAARKRIPPRVKVPVTVFVRLERPRHAIVEGRVEGRVELHAADEATAVRVGDRDVPLELEPTAALAYQLEGAPVWDFEIAGFRFAEHAVFADGLAMMHPYRPGRVPIVLVHGTASSPARWAELFNELQNDPLLGRRVQFWLFQYNTGQPILYSANLLRRALRAAVAELDPTGADPALRRMVIIGHSQGGLLAKLVTISSEGRFWANVTPVPLEQLDAPPETRELLQEVMFFEPLPEIERVIFVATPHRGSFRATGWTLNLIRRIVRLPGRLVWQFQELLTRPELAHLGISRLPTSVDNMSPGHPFIRVLSSIPVDPRITAHSIIAVRRPGPPFRQTDGVVAYESAHIDGVASERLVRSSHSTQGHPETIAEVRRILLEHLRASP